MHTGRLCAPLATLVALLTSPTSWALYARANALLATFAPKVPSSHLRAPPDQHHERVLPLRPTAKYVRQARMPTRQAALLAHRAQRRARSSRSQTQQYVSAAPTGPPARPPLRLTARSALGAAMASPTHVPRASLATGRGEPLLSAMVNAHLAHFVTWPPLLLNRAHPALLVIGAGYRALRSVRNVPLAIGAIQGGSSLATADTLPRVTYLHLRESTSPHAFNAQRIRRRPSVRA